MTDKVEVLRALPSYKDKWVTIAADQNVQDIITEVLQAHELNKPFYDRIALLFDNPDPAEICKGLYQFCKRNFTYSEEPERAQRTFTPQGALSVGKIDCKGYAGFCGGVLGGIERLTGKNLNWNYRFASYRLTDSTPGHVFIVVNDMGEELWIDPTPGAESKKPVWEINEKAKIGSMALIRNIAGVDDGFSYGKFTKALREPLFPTWQPDHYNPDRFWPREPFTVGSVVDTVSDVSSSDQNVLNILMDYGVLDARGNINRSRLSALPGVITAEDSRTINDSMYSGMMGSVFGDIFSFVQHNAAILGQQVPRAAFLGMVAINTFGYATKLQKALDYPDSHAKLQDIWERLGGKFSVLVSTINSGAKKKAILKGVGNSVGNPIVVAAAIGAATTIIAAIMPLITKMLAAHNVPADTVPLDPSTGLPYGVSAPGIGSGLIDWMRANPIPTIGIGLLVVYVALNYKSL